MTPRAPGVALPQVGVNAVFQSGFFNSTADADTPFAVFGNSGNKLGSLLLYFVVKFVTVVFSLTMPIPCGIFMPLLTVAGSFGRFYGEVVASLSSDPFEPGVYAMVACSAMIAGATHTISPCIVLIEITAQVREVASGGGGACVRAGGGVSVVGCVRVGQCWWCVRGCWRCVPLYLTCDSCWLVSGAW